MRLRFASLCFHFCCIVSLILVFSFFFSLVWLLLSYLLISSLTFLFFFCQHTTILSRTLPNNVALSIRSTRAQTPVALLRVSSCSSLSYP
ncbi:hypothetical protein NXS19_011829 [Fusarium pseudograminearum]|nr:hypothetical protein NXS19_011829 [Fusarium pseudograminearum]